MTKDEKIARLELPRPLCTYSDHSYPAYTAKQMYDYAEQCIAALQEQEIAQPMVAIDRAILNLENGIQLWLLPDGKFDYDIDSSKGLRATCPAYKCDSAHVKTHPPIADSDKLDAMLSALRNSIEVKGRHNAEVAFQRLVSEYDAAIAEAAKGGGK